MIRSLLLGNKIFPVNLIQGPLAGVSCAPFRLLTWRYSQPAFSCTEMISCKSLIHQPQLSYRRYVAKHANEGQVCFQLFGNNPAELAEATKIVTDCGADLIDLNCGCAVKKVRGQGAGSMLLENLPRLYKLICAMKQNTHLPVSVKIRVTGDEKSNMKIAQVVSDAGADFLVVHGRCWTEHYDIPCRHDEIKFFVEQLKIPVIGNGDVACVDSLRKMLATGCAGAMVGRAGVGQPWLIRKLIAETRQEEFTVPTAQEIGAMFIEQIEMLTELLESEKCAVLQARKLAGRYARCLPQRNEFGIAINACDNLNDLRDICRGYFVTPSY